MSSKGEFRSGDVVGDTYSVLGYIGQGAMGHVYRVCHRVLGTEYALKTLSSDTLDDQSWRRFQNEAQAISIMNHPNVIGIYNLGVHNGKIPFYVMDLLSGRDLSAMIRADGPIDVDTAVKIFTEVCAGLSYAHKKGIIHRDIKPGNIFLLSTAGPSGERVKVVDFGIAKVSHTKDQENQNLTAIGMVLGSPYYMSPEQCNGQRADARSDIYSLGCTLFECLTGTVPFRGRNVTETMMLHTTENPPSLEQASGGRQFPYELEMLIATALAKEKADRYQNVDQFSNALSVLSGRPQATSQFSKAQSVLSDKPQSTSQYATVGRVGRAVNDPGMAATAALTLRTNAGDLPRKSSALLIVLPVVATLICGGIFLYLWQTTLGKNHAAPAASDPMQRFNPQLEAPSQYHEVLNYVFEDKGKQFGNDIRLDYPPQGQVAKASLMLKTPFSTIVDQDGEKWRLFNFPSDVIVGCLKAMGGETMRAEGKLKFATDQKLVFTVADVAGAYPDCLKRFRPGDIFGLRFAPSSCSQAVIRATMIFDDLKFLDFSKCKPAPSDLPAIQALIGHNPNVEELLTDSSSIDGAFLARTSPWSNLGRLSACGIMNATPLLKRLKGDSKLQYISLMGCRLKPEDFIALGALQTLTELDLGSVPMTREDLVPLAGLPNLTYLHLGETGLTPRDLAPLKNARSLTCLDLSNMKMTGSQLKKILSLGKFVSLRLVGSGLGSEIIDLLKDYKPLKKLEIHSQEISKKDFQKIKDSLPDVHVS